MNPEFVRNLWLECSAHRLIAMPLILGLVMAVAWMGGSPATMMSAVTSAIGILLILWGTRLAADSVLGEVVDHTWDGQRMSAIGPWAMTWGKLFGSTIYVWYGAALCLILATLVDIVFVPQSGLTPGQVDYDRFLPAKLLAAGILGQAIALYVSLLLMRGRPQRLRFRVTVTQLVAITAALPFYLGARIYSWPGDGLYSVSWYGIETSVADFLVASNLLFAAWAIFGCYRLMRLELQYRAGLWGWLSFTLFLPLYLAGIDSHGGWLDMRTAAGRSLDWWLAAFLTTLALSYIAALTEPKGVLRLKRWFHDLGTRSVSAAQASTPSWVVSGAVCLCCAGVTVTLSLSGGPESLEYAPFVASLLLFATRDIALLYALTLDSRRRRGHLAALVYLAVLYGLVPAFLAGMGAGDLTHAFVPTLGGDAMLSTVAVLVQALAALAFATVAWRRLMGRTMEDKSPSRMPA